MPGFFFPGRPGCEHNELMLDMVFDGRSLPPDAPREMHDLARMLARLAGPAEPGLLAGEAVARSAFTCAVSPVGLSPAAHEPAGRTARLPGPRRARLAAALVAAAALFGSTAAAAYAGVLPDPVQNFAHTTIGAPVARHVSQHQRGGHQADNSGHPAPPTGPTSATARDKPGHLSHAPKHGHPAHPAVPGHPARHGKVTPRRHSPRHSGHQLTLPRSLHLAGAPFREP